MLRHYREIMAVVVAFSCLAVWLLLCEVRLIWRSFSKEYIIIRPRAVVKNCSISWHTSWKHMVCSSQAKNARDTEKMGEFVIICYKIVLQ